MPPMVMPCFNLLLSERSFMADTLAAISIVEGIEDASIEQQLDAWQQLVDSGLCWRLKGWYGRTATQLIDQGLIRPAK
ncbi:MAG: DUF7417 domain-containing protein [Hylemonella sp.]